MRSIWKKYDSTFIPTIGWTDTTGDKNMLWPFSNSGILQYVLLFGILVVLVGILMAMGAIGEWIIRSVFALFG